MTQDAVHILNRLIETSKDGQYGFETSAKHARSAELVALFKARAAECERAAEQLQGLILQLGGKPEKSGSVSGAIHRGWVSLRDDITGHTDLAILEECERGEDVAKAHYSKALEEKALPESVRNLVEQQYQGVVRNHDLIRDWRDRLRSAT